MKKIQVVKPNSIFSGVAAKVDFSLSGLPLLADLFLA
jgi:hypothetical protein